MNSRTMVVLVAFFALAAAAFSQPITPQPPDAFQVNYAGNLPIGDSVVNITNSGDSGGSICVNVYAFAPDEQLVSCCACNVTPNGLESLSDKNDLISNTLTPAVPSSIVIKLVATSPSSGSCNAATPTANNLVSGLAAWGTHLHPLPTAPVTYGVSENAFLAKTLSQSELSRITTYCGFIQAQGSGYGICRSCRLGALGGATK